MNVQTMALDVSKETEAQSTITIRQGDKNGTILNVGIFDNGTALNLTSLTVRMCAKLPDGVHYYSVNGTASGNTATFEIDESYAAAYPGITDLAYVDVLDGDDVICSTQPFRLVVEHGAREGVVPSEEHIAEIDAAVERANEAARECEELAYPITESQIDSIVSDTSVTSTNKLSATGLTYLWGKLKAAFASILHTHANASSTAAGFMSASEHDKLSRTTFNTTGAGMRAVRFELSKDPHQYILFLFDTNSKTIKVDVYTADKGWWGQRTLTMNSPWT